MTDGHVTRFIYLHSLDTILILVTIIVNDEFRDYFQKCGARWLATAIFKHQKPSAF
jgi:hypothetical protein